MPAKLTQEEFIQKAEKIHGKKYDYSYCNYVNFNTKVNIICKIHGNFWQRPIDGHLKGQGCPKCFMQNVSIKRTRTIEEFTNKANKVHGKKYDYSSAIYKKSNIKIKIKCLGCGNSFSQTPSAHINAHNGCPKCAKNEKKSLKLFIRQASLVHKNKYDYAFSTYTNTHCKIDILCPFHGIFKQEPNSHLTGRGCPRCAKNAISNTENFTKEATLIHEGKYDYRLTDYKHSKAKVIISCPIHGPFKQTPNSHLNGKGCPKCKNSISKMERKWLDSVSIPNTDRNRQVILVINGKKYLVDGYIPETKTVYEFYGDYWHGNMSIFSRNDINKIRHKTFGELYDETMNREKDLIDYGYILVTICESDFEKQLIKTINRK